MSEHKVADYPKLKDQIQHNVSELLGDVGEWPVREYRVMDNTDVVHGWKTLVVKREARYRDGRIALELVVEVQGEPRCG